MMIRQTKLTDNFNLDDFELSQEATRRGIDNSVPVALVPNVWHLAIWLQTLRDRLTVHFNKDTPINISSGYRCRELNTAIKGSRGSMHMDGLAADIWVKNLAPEKLLNLIYELMKDCSYDQVINEYDRWIHIGLIRDGYDQYARRELLKATHYRNALGMLKTRYTRVIPC